MPYSQKQIQDRALRIATMAGGDPNTSQVVDNNVALEDLFYDALRSAVLDGSQYPSEVGNLMRDHTISVTDGVGVLPDSVINEELDQSSVYSEDGDDIGQLNSYQPRYMDYVRGGQSQLAYYAVKGTDFLFRDIGGDANDFDGDIHLVTVSIPAIPATITDPITIGSETAERCIQLLAEMLKGALVAE